MKNEAELRLSMLHVPRDTQEHAETIVGQLVYKNLVAVDKMLLDGCRKFYVPRDTQEHTETIVGRERIW